MSTVRSGGSVMDAERLMEAAAAAAREGDTGTALRLYDELLPLLAGGRQEDWVDTLRHIGTVHRQRGDTAEAEKWYRHSLEEAERLDYRPGVAHAANWLAVLAVRRGEMERAEQEFDAAAYLAEQAGDLRLLSMIEQNLGVLANIRGDLDAALARYRASLTSARSFDDAEMTASILNNIGVLNMELFRWDESEAAYAEAAGIASVANLAALCNAIELNVAELDAKREKWADAAMAGRDAADTARRQENRWVEAEALRISGMSNRRQRRLGDAERELLRAATLATECQDRLLEAQVAHELGEVYVALERMPEGRASLIHALELFRVIGAAPAIRVVKARLQELAPA